MDLLEYQGKQLFAKHGVAVPEGRHAADRRRRRRGRERDRLPVRGQGPGRDRQARQGRRDQGRQGRGRGREHSEAILGMDIRGFTVHDLWIEQASEIAAEYYASVILDRSEKKLLVMLSRMGGMDVEEIAETDPDALVQRHVEPGRGVRRRRRRARSPSTPGSTTTSSTRSPRCWSSSSRSRSPRTRR